MAILRANGDILRKGNESIIQGAFYGNGLNFPGVDEWVNSVNSPLLDFERTDAFSISTIVRQTSASTDGNASAFYSKTDTGIIGGSALRGYSVGGSGASGFVIYFRFSYSLALATAENFQVNTLAAVGVLNEVCYYTFVKEAGELSLAGTKIYKNGIQQPTQIVTNSTPYRTIKNAATAKLGVLRETGGATRGKLFGDLYSTQVYNRALTQLEVTQLYESDNRNLTGLEANLVADWRFDENQGGTIRDYSPNQLNGTMVNYTAGEQSLGALNKHVNYLGNPILF